MEFSEVFAQLRRDRNLSQRQAAAELKISQALLSHYENGLREPRLDFVVRACEYYGVSADYILGRTSAHANPMLTQSATTDGGDLSALWEKGNMYSLLNAVTVITNMLACMYHESVVEKTYDYLGVALYALFRNLKLESDSDLKKLVSLPEYKFRLVCDVASKKAECELAEYAHNVNPREKHDCAQEIRERFPAAYEKFAEWLSDMEENLAKQENQ